MAYANKLALKTAVIDRMGRTDITTAQIDRFIRNAEARANRLLRLREDQCVSTAAVTAASEYVVLPNDWGGLTEARWTDAAGNTTVLRHVDHKAGVDRKLESVTSGTPQFYSIVKNTYWLIPSPIEAGTLTVFVKERFELLTDTDSNALLANDPDIYFNGALYEAKAFFEEPESEILLYEKRFLDGIRELRISDWHDKSGGSRGEEAEYF